MKQYFAVIDTNVLVSALLNWESTPGCVLQLVDAGLVIPIIHKDILREYKTVLLRPKFSLTGKIVSDVLEMFEKQGVSLDPQHVDALLPDEKDRVFYEVVLEKRKENDAYLVTGNMKHFPKEPFIVTPREFLEIVLSEN